MNMKVSTKPISSPGRTDKFPPPLMRFLRSNAGSRSRRSRSSPMFVRKKNTTNNIETQEPSSPKVTCMGQVRVRRSSKQPLTTKRDTHTTPTPCPCRCRCRWIPIPKPNPSRCLWPNWPIFRRKPSKLKQESIISHSNFKSNYDSDHQVEERVNVDKDNNNNNINNNFASTTTPPKNALLLTRCRSAPFRSSSLAGRFWGSPLRNEEETEFATNAESTCDESEESVSRNTETEPPKLGFFKELEDSIRDRIASITKLENVEELSKGREVERDSAIPSGPVVLTRCKSEPARTGHRLDPEVNNLWKKKRLGFD